MATCVCPAVAALGPRFYIEAIDRAAVRCVLQRGSSRQNPMRRRTVESWNMLMKEARLLLRFVVGDAVRYFFLFVC